ncbi:MAG: transglycosylase SLT domain-containing protein [Bacteroidetes bacterium]|nr:transglycosylase SLT domain-containing protein [Bacteroidota bacterium]
MPRIFYLPIISFAFLLTGNSLPAQVTANVRPDIIQVTTFNDTALHNMVKTNQIYEAGLDTLPQILFWRRIMHLTPDSGIVSLASNRFIYSQVSTLSWDNLGTAGQDAYRDSVRKKYVLNDSASVLFTKGKNDFYDASAVIPQIDRAIPIFVQQGVDPFFAQAILLIESPGKTLKSNVGANGAFQLMKSVAIQMGLKVNKTVDERKDFEKASWAAAKLLRTVCIPYTRSMLEKRGIAYNENDLWFRLLVLHVYHAGAGNVDKALTVIAPCDGGMQLIETLWQTKAGAFGKSSQSYSQLAISALLDLDAIYGIHTETARINKTPLENQESPH